MLSSSDERSLARRFRLEAVKKLDGLSMAELTFLPVESFSWIFPCSALVFWSVERFVRTALERTIPDIIETFLVLRSFCFRTAILAVRGADICAASPKERVNGPPP